MSWQQAGTVTASANGQHVQGLGIQDGEIYITAVEDMGGGWAASARGGWTMRGRGSPILDRDAVVTLTTPAGVVTTGALRSCGSMMAQLSGVVTGSVYSSNESNNFTPLNKCSMVDIVGFTTKVSAFTVGALYGELENRAINASGALIAPTNTSVVSANTVNDLGNGTGLTFTQINGEYAGGPFVAGFDWTHFNAASMSVVYPLTGTAIGGAYLAADGLDRYRFYARYDAGFAKFAAGVQQWTGNMANQYVASATVPVGNFTFGLDYTARDAQGAPSTPAIGAVGTALFGVRNGDKASSSVGVGMNYNFSKTTTLNASYITYTDAGVNTLTNTPAQLDNEYRIRLMKTF
jgi:hypothetical protein